MALRVGTFNARFLPHLPSNARRAAVLADRIAERSYDLVALTEVFSARARRVLIERLAPSYPWNVQYIGSRWIVRGDSGLMLLSRLPFEPIPTSPQFGHSRIRASASGTVPDWPHVWFVEYGDCSSSDCLAGKGAGYVRVRYGGRPLNVFFTHMQAAYDHHGPQKQARTRQVRSTQLKQLASLVGAAFGTGKAASENTLILGDLNVDGVRCGVDAGPKTEPDGIEWTDMLARLNRLFPTGLSDVWDRHAPLGDPGNTFPAWNPIARRDYVLLSAADSHQPLAVHHVALDRDMAQPYEATRYLSDHLGIRVDLNLHQPGCHPLDAHRVGHPYDGAVLHGVIRHSGGLQWYRVDHLGGVEIEIGFPGANSGTALEVYQAGDISRPLTPQSRSGGADLDSRRYTLAGDALIRVGEPRSEMSGRYSLGVKPVM